MSYRNGIQLFTGHRSKLSKFSKNLHAASANSQAERKCKEIQVPVPWGHVAGKWWGPQDQRPILCLHGWQESCGSFDPLIQRLPEDTGYLALDLPGHGHSSRMPKGIYYHANDSSILIRRIQKYFGWSKVSLMAHSMSAVLSFLFTAWYPDDVDLLIQLDLFKPFSQRPGSAIASAVKYIDQFIGYDELNDAKTHLTLYTYDELVHKICEATRNSLAPHNAKFVLNRICRQSHVYPTKYVFPTDMRLRIPVIGGMLGAMQHDDICEHAKRIKCPMLTLKATDSSYFEDQTYFDDVAGIVQANNKDFQLVRVEGTHHVHVNEPQKIAAIVNQFLVKYKHVDRAG